MPCNFLFAFSLFRIFLFLFPSFDLTTFCFAKIATKCMLVYGELCQLRNDTLSSSLLFFQLQIDLFLNICCENIGQPKVQSLSSTPCNFSMTIRKEKKTVEKYEHTETEFKAETKSSIDGVCAICVCVCVCVLIYAAIL